MRAQKELSRAVKEEEKGKPSLAGLTDDFYSLEDLIQGIYTPIYIIHQSLPSHKLVYND